MTLVRDGSSWHLIWMNIGYGMICVVVWVDHLISSSAVVTWLTKIVNHVWPTEQIPADWRKGIILPFWKRKGDALTCSNHRGITLLSIPGKTFARVVINQAIPAMHHHRRPHQAGFMPGRSTTDHISAIRLLAEKAREFRKDRALFIAFIYLKAAFDSVDRDCL